MTAWICLELEVAAMFRGLPRSTWAAIEESAWHANQRRREYILEYGHWYSRTSRGRHLNRASGRRYVVRLKTVVVSTSRCRICKKAFGVTAYKRLRGRTEVCSNACRALTRKNVRSFTINGRTQLLQQWADEYGIGVATVNARLRAGASVSEALTRPVRRAA